MIVLLDTNVIIDALNQRNQRHRHLYQLMDQNHVLASCAVTVAEVYAGMRPHESRATTAFLAGLEFFDTTQSVARRAGLLKSSWRKKGQTLDLPDALIAAVALEHGLALATDNRKHFPMPDLHLVDLPRPA
jgi:predicted nucleic acid-binding protein